MNRRNITGLVALAAAFALVLAACGDSAAPDPSATTSEAPAVTADMGGMDEMDGENHEHDEAIEWDGKTPPQLGVEVVADGNGGFLAVASVDGFTFSSPNDLEHVPGFGHTHVFIDGALLSMSYEPVVGLPELEPGMHEIMVVLSRNDHADYALDGRLITAMAMLEIEGEATPADMVVEVDYRAGIVSAPARIEVSVGDIVEIVVTSDTHEEIHLHGYDITRMVMPGAPATLRFTADIPGIFEVELEESRTRAFELRVE